MQNGDLPQTLAYAEYGLQLDREGEDTDISTEALKVLWRVYERMDDRELARRSLEELGATERRLEQRAATPPAADRRPKPVKRRRRLRGSIPAGARPARARHALAQAVLALCPGSLPLTLTPRDHD